MTKVTTDNNQNVTENRFEIIKPNIKWSKKVYNANAPALHQKVMKAVLLVLAFLVEIFIKNPAILAYDLGALIGNKLFPKRVTPISPTIAKSEGTISSLDNKKTDAAPQEKTAGPAGQPGPAEAPILFTNAPSHDLPHPSPQAPQGLSVSVETLPSEAHPSPQGLSTPISSDTELSGTPLLLIEAPQGPAPIAIPSPGSAFVSFPRALSTSPVSPAASDDLALLPAPTSVVAVAAQVLSPIASKAPSPAPVAAQAQSPVAAVVERVVSPVAAKAPSPAPSAQSAPSPVARQAGSPVAELISEITSSHVYTDADLQDDLAAFEGLGLSEEQLTQAKAILFSKANFEDVSTFQAEVFFRGFNLPVPNNLNKAEFLTKFWALHDEEDYTKENIVLWLNRVQALVQSYFVTIANTESVAARTPSPATVPAPESAASPATVPADTVETSTSPMHFEEEPPLQVAAQMPSPVAPVVERVVSPVAAKAPSPAPAAQSAPAPVSIQAPSPVESAPSPVVAQTPSPVAAVVERVVSPVAAKVPSPEPAVELAPLQIAENASPPDVISLNLEDLHRKSLEYSALLELDTEQRALLYALPVGNSFPTEFKADVVFGAFNLPVPKNFNTEEFLSRYRVLESEEIPLERIKTQKDALQVLLSGVQRLLQSYFEPIQSASAPVAMQAPSPVESAPSSLAAPSATPEAEAPSSLEEEVVVPQFTSNIVAQSPVRSPLWGGLNKDTVTTKAADSRIQSPVDIIDPEDRTLPSPVDIIDPEDRTLPSPVDIIDPEDAREAAI